MTTKRKLKAVLLSMPLGTKIYYAGPYAWRMRKGRETLVSNAQQGFKSICAEFTTKCNYRCAYCGRVDAVTNGWRDVSDGNVDTIKESFRNVRKIADVDGISIGGLGEPTLHKNFSELMNFVYSEYRDKSTNMDSNFSMMTEDRALALVGKLDSITFSMNIPVPEEYAKIEGANTLNQAIENFKRFMSIRRELGTQKPSVRIQLFQGYESRYGWVLKQFKEYDGEFAVNFKPINNFFGHLHPIQSNREKITTCYSLSNSLSVTKEGDVYGCCSGFYLGKNSELYLGNACKDEPSIMRSRLEGLITKLREQGLSSIKDCATCDIHYTMTASNLKRQISECDRNRISQ